MLNLVPKTNPLNSQCTVSIDLTKKFKVKDK